MLTVAAVIVAGIRPFVPTSPLSWSAAYQAVAHLLVGVLVGAYMVRSPLMRQKPTSWQRWFGFLVVALSVVEVVCFAVGRFVG